MKSIIEWQKAISKITQPLRDRKKLKFKDREKESWGNEEIEWRDHGMLQTELANVVKGLLKKKNETRSNNQLGSFCSVNCAPAA